MSAAVGSTMLDAALAYAARDLAIFPCDVKVPLVKWREEATTDPDRLRRFWTRWPTANIGLPMGARNGLVALDIDNKNGVNGAVVVAALEADLGALPATWTQTTPSGGTHKIYTSTAAAQIRNSASVIRGVPAPGLDIRGEGGYPVVAPSRGYVWTDTRPPAELPSKWAAVLTPLVREAVDVPAWVPANERDRGSATRWSVAALQREARELASTPSGSRNDRLWRSAAALGGLLHLRGIDAADVRRALTWACSTWGQRDVRKDAETLERALMWGSANPRTCDLSDRSAT